MDSNNNEKVKQLITTILSLPKRTKTLFRKTLYPEVVDIQNTVYEDNSLQSKNNDSHFSLNLKEKSQFFKLVSNISSDNPSATTQLFYKYDENDIYEEAKSIILGKVNITNIYFLSTPSPVLYFRLDCIDKNGKFTLNYFEVIKISELEYNLINKIKIIKNIISLIKYDNSLIMKFFIEVKKNGIKKSIQKVNKHVNTLDSLSNYPGEIDTNHIKNEIDKFEKYPTFSILIPIYNVDEKWLVKCLDSVINQIYIHWEICAVDDASTKPHIRAILKEYMNKDDRIKVIFRDVNGHISKASNDAISLATKEYICLLDHDDIITKDALYEFSKVINLNEQVDMIYSDEDKVDIYENRFGPFYKPDWSPEYFETCMYTCHFGCYKSELVREIGGFREGYEGAQDYDFVLRVTEKTDKIYHVPKVLYSWRMIPESTAFSIDAKPYAINAAIKALASSLDRKNKKGIVKEGLYPGSFDVEYAIENNPLVSIIIPTAGKKAIINRKEVDLLSNCVNNIYNNTKYKNYEIIIIDNNDLREETEDLIIDKNYKLIHFKEDIFNIPKKINLGVQHASGDYLLILNDDIEIITNTWLDDMLETIQRTKVGAVGAKLLFDDNTIQHVGVTFHNGLPGHVCYGDNDDGPGYVFRFSGKNNYMAVTGACMLTKTALFNKVDGWDENLPVHYNDVDYCLKLYALGYRIVLNPKSKLYHYESKSRERGIPTYEIEYFLNKWKSLVEYDPYHNINFQPGRY